MEDESPMTDRRFDYGAAAPYLETARVDLESHGFRFEGGSASAADRGEYRFKMPNRRTSIYVQAPVTRAGRVRVHGRFWRWSPSVKPPAWTYATALKDMVAGILQWLDGDR